MVICVTELHVMMCVCVCVNKHKTHFKKLVSDKKKFKQKYCPTMFKQTSFKNLFN